MNSTTSITSTCWCWRLGEFTCCPIFTFTLFIQDLKLGVEIKYLLQIWNCICCTEIKFTLDI